MGNWAWIVNFMLPLPLASLLLLSLPLPNFLATSVRRIVLSILNFVLFRQLIYGFNVYQLSVLISIALFAQSGMETIETSGKLKYADSAVLEAKLKCNKWRVERNFWISFLSLVLWIILQRMYLNITEVETLKRQLKEKEQDDKKKD